VVQGKFILLLSIVVAATWFPAAARAQPPFYPPYPNSALRFDVKPKQAQVYVDGYYEGMVDDFDGAFQRLHVTPGEHDVALYLEGYRTVRQTIRLTPRSTYKVHYRMEHLGTGETSEAPPEPPAPSGPGRPPVARGLPPPFPPPGGGARSTAGSVYGTLAIRSEPADAAVLIDGERWEGSGGEERLVVELAEGRHHVDVRKDGYEPFSTDLQVRRGETTPLNVTLHAR